jgi:hypothetical protein
MEPINYMLDIQSPIQQALKGYGLGRQEIEQNQIMDERSQMMDLRAAQEARAVAQEEERRATAASDREAAIAARERGNAAMMRLIDLGSNATTKDYLIAIAENPEYRESLATVASTFGEERKQNEIGSSLKIWSALQSDPEVARSLITERKRAAEAAGDKQTYDAMSALELQLDGENGARVLSATLGSGLVELMGADAFKAAAETLGIGSGEGEKEIFDREKQIRKEYTDLTKDYRTVAQAYDRVSASQDTGPGDIALIFNYMKMLDPGSTVREGEFATAQNSGGIPTAIQNLYNNAVDGQRLTPEQRALFKSQAGDLFKAASKSEESARLSLMPVISEYGLDESRIFGAPSVTSGNTGGDLPQSFLTNPNVTNAATAAGVTVQDMWNVMTPEQRARYGG